MAKPVRFVVGYPGGKNEMRAAFPRDPPPLYRPGQDRGENMWVARESQPSGCTVLVPATSLLTMACGFRLQVAYKPRHAVEM